jgi:hypothetical protein
MKNITFIISITLFSSNTFAICPSLLSGKYAGAGEYTEQSIINKIPVISNVKYSVVSINIVGNFISAVKEYAAEAGTGKPAIENPIGTAPFIYDKTTCTGRMGNLSDPTYFTVSNSGNNLNFIHGKYVKDKNLYAEKWNLEKQ